jgi:hypothetical protein
MSKFMCGVVVCAAFLPVISDLSAGDEFLDLVHRRLSSADPAVRIIGLEDAASLDEKQTVPILKDFIAGETNPDVLCEAARLCGEIHSPELVPTIEGILKRQSAGKIMIGPSADRKPDADTKNENADSAEDLAARLRGACLAALVRIGGDKAIACLAGMLQGGTLSARIDAAGSLSELGNNPGFRSKCLDKLMKSASEERDARVLKHIASALGNIEDQKAVPVLNSLLYRQGGGMVAIGGSSSTEFSAMVLKQNAEIDRAMREMRTAALAALRAIGGTEAQKCIAAYGNAKKMTPVKAHQVGLATGGTSRHTARHTVEDSAREREKPAQPPVGRRQ